MAHEGIALFMVFLAVLLIIGFYLGPNRETRIVKRQEGKIMLIPSAIILVFLAIIVYSGVLG
jgi:heme A synthase